MPAAKSVVNVSKRLLKTLKGRTPLRTRAYDQLKRTKINKSPVATKKSTFHAPLLARDEITICNGTEIKSELRHSNAESYVTQSLRTQLRRLRCYRTAGSDP